MLTQLVSVQPITHSTLFHPEGLISCDYRYFTAQRDCRDLFFLFFFSRKLKNIEDKELAHGHAYLEVNSTVEPRSLYFY